MDWTHNQGLWSYNQTEINGDLKGYGNTLMRQGPGCRVRDTSYYILLTLVIVFRLLWGKMGTSEQFIVKHFG